MIRLIKGLLGLFLIGCSGTVLLTEFLPHWRTRLTQLFEQEEWPGIVLAIARSTPPFVCCVATFIAGILLIIHALAPGGISRTLGTLIPSRHEAPPII